MAEQETSQQATAAPSDCSATKECTIHADGDKRRGSYSSKQEEAGRSEEEQEKFDEEKRTEEEEEEVEEEYDFDRHVTFVDAAVAIALTLLILPLVDASSDVAAGTMTAREWYRENSQTISAFALGFLVVSDMWIDQAALFIRLKRCSKPLRVLHFCWLIFVVFMPVSSNLTYAGAKEGAYPQFIINILLARVLLLIMVLLGRYNKTLWKRADRGVPFYMAIDCVLHVLLYSAALAIAFALETAWGLLFLLVATVLVPVLRWLRPGTMNS